MKINAINPTYLNPSFQKRAKAKTPQQNLQNVDLNNQPISKINKSLVKRKYGELLQPKCFISNPKDYESCLSIFRKRKFDYIQVDEETGNISFKPELTPQKLPLTKEKFKGYEISNFQNPNGSIAIQTRLKTTISTSGLYQCAAASFVDRKNNLQSLLHLCPTVDKNSNKKLLEYLISNCEKDNLEISIVAGCDKYTDDTITFIMDFIKENCPNSKVNFMDYPDEYHSILILNNGDLQCLDSNSNFECLSTNPYSKIIYA